MPKTHVSRKISINAPVEKVHQIVSDFHHWTKWSPWLICEPEAKVNVDTNGKHYTWEGKRVGTGEMTVKNESANKISYDLQFLKPWKSKASVDFKLKPSGNETEVEWTMDSSLPFFMFWLKKTMEAAIGMDYDRGLKMLKDYVEDGEVHSKLEFVGEHDISSCSYIGIDRNSNFDRIGADMQADFTNLSKFVREQPDLIDGVPFSIYKKFDIKNGNVSYTAAIPVKSIPANLPSEFYSSTLPEMKVNTVRHHGPYEHIGNAWSANMMMARNKEFKQNKRIPPIEFYINDPAEVSANELISEISIPVK